jgi:hypothetical protein
MRNTGGKPSVLIIFNNEEMEEIDEILGDCGAGPIELSGYLKMSDSYGPCYVSMWNPKLNDTAEIPPD